ncbi:hypothetical protein U1Q18_003486 [Sarracenia purpurea var. burkii]
MEMIQSDRGLKFILVENGRRIGHVPPVQRSVRKILPLLHPPEHLSSMWSTFLGEFLQYLPSDSTHQSAEDNPEQTSTVHNIYASSKIIKHETPKVTGLILPKNDGPSLTSGLNTSTTTGVSSYLLAEKLVPVLVDLFLQAPSVEKYKMFPEVLQGLARLAAYSSCFGLWIARFSL